MAQSAVIGAACRPHASPQGASPLREGDWILCLRLRLAQNDNCFSLFIMHYPLCVIHYGGVAAAPPSAPICVNLRISPASNPAQSATIRGAAAPITAASPPRPSWILRLRSAPLRYATLCSTPRRKGSLLTRFAGVSPPHVPPQAGGIFCGGACAARSRSAQNDKMGVRFIDRRKGQSCQSY